MLKIYFSGSDKENRQMRQKQSHKISTISSKSKENLKSTNNNLKSKHSVQIISDAIKKNAKRNEINGYNNSNHISIKRNNISNGTSLNLPNDAIVDENHKQTNGFTTKNSNYVQDNRPLVNKLNDRKSLR